MARLLPVVCAMLVLATSAVLAQNEPSISTENNAMYMNGAAAVFQTADMPSAMPQLSFAQLLTMVVQMNATIQDLQTFKTNVVGSPCPSGNFVSFIKDDGTVVCSPSVDGSKADCSAGGGAIEKINSDGSVVCAQGLADQVSNSTAFISALRTQTCSVGDFVSAVNADGTVVCQAALSTITADCSSVGAIKSISGGAVQCANAGPDQPITCPMDQHVSIINTDFSFECSQNQGLNNTVSGLSGTVQALQDFQSQLAQTDCTTGSFSSGVDSNGTLVCSAVATATPAYCPNGQTLVGLDTSLQPECAQDIALVSYDVQLERADVNVADNTYLQPSVSFAQDLTAWSVSLWVSMSAQAAGATSTPQYVLSYAKNTATDLQISFNPLQVWMGGSSSGTVLSTTLPALDGDWHHVLITYNSNTRSMLAVVDGVVTTAQTTATAMTVPAGGRLVVGAVQTTAPPADMAFSSTNFFQGRISQMSIYDTELTGVQRLQTECFSSTDMPRPVVGWYHMLDNVVGPSVSIVRPSVLLDTCESKPNPCTAPNAILSFDTTAQAFTCGTTITLTEADSGECTASNVGTVRYNTQVAATEQCTLSLGLTGGVYYWPCGGLAECLECTRDSSNSLTCLKEVECPFPATIRGRRCVPKPSVVHLTFDETLADSSGNNNDGVYMTQAFAVATEDPVYDITGAKEGSAALVLGGTSNFVQIPAQTISAMTSCSWVRYDSFGIWQRVFDFANGQASDNILFANTQGTNGGTFSIFRGNAGGNALSVPNYWIQGQYQLACVSVDSTGLMKMYRNGVLMGSFDGNPPNHIERTRMLVAESNWSNDAVFAGDLDEFRVWNTTLTDEDIAALMCFEDQNPIDCKGIMGLWSFNSDFADSSIIRWGTAPSNGVTANTALTTVAVEGKAYDVGVGTTSINSRNFGGEMTFSFYYRQMTFDHNQNFENTGRFFAFHQTAASSTGSLGGNTPFRIVCGPAAAFSRRFYFIFNGGSATTGLGAPAGCTGNDCRIIENSVLSVNSDVWQHIAVVVGSDNLRLYLNGALFTTVTTAGGAGIPYATRDGYIGRQEDADAFTLDTLLDQFRIYGYAMSDADVQTLYGLYPQA